MLINRGWLFLLSCNKRIAVFEVGDDLELQRSELGGSGFHWQGSIISYLFIFVFIALRLSIYLDLRFNSCRTSQNAFYFVFFLCISL